MLLILCFHCFVLFFLYFIRFLALLEFSSSVSPVSSQLIAFDAFCMQCTSLLFPMSLMLSSCSLKLRAHRCDTLLQLKLDETVKNVAPVSTELDCLPDFSVVSDAIGRLQLRPCNPPG